MILSLQGCMAVGKTTAVRYLQEHAPYVHISYEDNSDVIAEIKQRNLDKNKYEDYLEIQRLWLRKEVQRWEKAKQYPITVMDFGAEEIEFYTLNYPKTIGMDWDVEQALKPELNAVRACMPDRILFLNASEETLRRNKQNDSTRSRNFFDHYLRHFLPLKKAWFTGRHDVDVLDVGHLSPEEVGQRVKAWVDRWRSAEIWDAYYADGSWAGQYLIRGEPIPEGLHHLVSEILVRHTDGDYLLMQRDFRKPNYGGFFEATAGGSALKDEDALSCARRELLEETGIAAGTLTNIGRFVSHDAIYENFLCVTDCDKNSVKLQEGETVSYKWVSETEFIEFVNSGAMIDVQFQRYEHYLKQIGYIK